MNKILKTGFRIKTLLGKTAEVEKFIDEEEQYTAYEVVYMNQAKVLIWFKNECWDAEVSALYRDLVQNPSPKSSIFKALQTLDITEWKDGTFGYIIDCPPQDYDELIKEILHTSGILRREDLDEPSL